MKKKTFYIVYLFSVVTLIFCGIEFYLNYLINHPEKCSEENFTILAKYYQESERSVIQYETAMAKYDTELFYTLKPGEFVFSNSEFSTPFLVNSLGCRDDEVSINYPKIVMIGDSYTMGWGVDQDDTYANLVEQRSGLPVLNMGVSSYGTPREITFLERIETDSVQYLVIQHCPNDYGEIVQHHMHNNKLVVSDQHIYDSITYFSHKNKSYYPFKRSVELLPFLLCKTRTEITDTNYYPPLPSINISKKFLTLIRNAKNIPKHTKIIAFTLGVKGFSNDFMQNVKTTLDKEFGSSLHDQISFLDFSSVLTPEHYFVLDAHINNLGHQLIADSILKFIQKQPTGFSEKTWNYDNGNVSIHSSYFDHYKEGITTYYWPNGAISQQTIFHKGEKKGEEITYNKYGQEIKRKTYP